MARKKVTLSFHEGLFYAAIERLPKESAPALLKIIAERTLDSRSFQKALFFPQNSRTGLLTKEPSTFIRSACKPEGSVECFWRALQIARSEPSLFAKEEIRSFTSNKNSPRVG